MSDKIEREMCHLYTHFHVHENRLCHLFSIGCTLWFAGVWKHCQWSFFSCWIWAHSVSFISTVDAGWMLSRYDFWAILPPTLLNSCQNVLLLSISDEMRWDEMRDERCLCWCWCLKSRVYLFINQSQLILGGKVATNPTKASERKIETLQVCWNPYEMIEEQFCQVNAVTHINRHYVGLSNFFSLYKVSLLSNWP